MRKLIVAAITGVAALSIAAAAAADVYIQGPHGSNGDHGHPPLVQGR
jgi:hypothetical protein